MIASRSLRWTPREALQLLRDVPNLETAGVVVRMPAAWRGNRPPRPRVTGTVGTKTLVAFSIAAVPANQVITSATLTITVADAGTFGSSTTDLYRLLASWVEGDGTSVTTTSAATSWPSVNWPSATR